MAREPVDEPVSSDAQDTPPLGSWSRMYALVLGVLVLEIILFSLFTEAFR